MSSLDSTFEEIRKELGNSRGLDPAKSDPVFYFVHPAEQTLELKAKLPLWKAILSQEGKEVVTVSLSDLVWDIIDQSGRWEPWLENESEHEPVEINEAIRDVLRGPNGLVEALAHFVSEQVENRVLFVIDAGLVHPYFRVRTLESGLHDRVKVPTIIFYPGRRSGLYGLRFLGFYAVDGNYRSTLIGGQL